MLLALTCTIHGERPSTVLYALEITVKCVEVSSDPRFAAFTYGALSVFRLLLLAVWTAIAAYCAVAANFAGTPPSRQVLLEKGETHVTYLDGRVSSTSMPGQDQRLAFFAMSGRVRVLPRKDTHKYGCAERRVALTIGLFANNPLAAGSDPAATETSAT